MINVIFIMLTTFLRYCILLLRSFILISFHPIFIGILILVLCLFIRITISLLTHSWLRFLLFYLISGGILILLIYISCYRFNPIFKKRLIFILIMAISSFIVIKQHPFLFKKRFSVIMFAETGSSLRYDINIRMFILIRLFIFLCFFNIRKILTSRSFSIRKFYLRRNIRTANSYLYQKYLLISK